MWKGYGIIYVGCALARSEKDWWYRKKSMCAEKLNGALSFFKALC